MFGQREGRRCSDKSGLGRISGAGGGNSEEQGEVKLMNI